MYKTLIASILLLFCGEHLIAQSPLRTYTLSGTINTDTGTMILYTSKKLTAHVVDGKFVFADSADNPVPATIQLHKGKEFVYISGQFFIEPGIQTIACDANDSARRSPAVSNQTMKEYERYNKQVEPIWNEIALQYDISYSLRRIYNKNIPENIISRVNARKDSLYHAWHLATLQYAKAHRSSYIVLWELYSMLQIGYDPIYSAIYNQLSTPLKKSGAGKKLAEKIAYGSTVMIGSVFPSLHVKNTSDGDTTLVIRKNKYTLVDFWYSHCGPCKQQFPAFRRLYDQYKNEGLEIIGISIDQADAISDWKKVISDLRATWPQYRDNGKVYASKFSINSYPTNFLLNDKGEIIKRNVSIEELGNILKAGLNLRDDRQ